MTETQGPGQPTKYNLDIAEKICDMISTGMSVREICKSDDFPDRVTVYRWLSIHPEFREMYQVSKIEGAIVYAEQIIDIADNVDEDVNRSRLKIDSRKWILSKILPKKYGLNPDDGEDEAKITEIVRRIVKNNKE